MKSDLAITWKHWLVGGLIVGFAVDDVYCAHVYGEVYVPYFHWITFANRPYWYVFSLAVSIACLVLISIGVATWSLERIFKLNVRKRWQNYERLHSDELSRTQDILRSHFARRRTTARDCKQPHRLR